MPTPTERVALEDERLAVPAARTTEYLHGTLRITQIMNNLKPIFPRLEATGVPVQEWADEIDDDITPREHLEGFYTLVAMQFGDPDKGAWLRDQSTEVRKLYHTYVDNNPKIPRENGNAVILSYMVWYERNRPAT